MFAPHWLLLLVAVLETIEASCDHNTSKFDKRWKPMSVEKRAVRSSIVFKGLLTNRHRTPPLPPPVRPRARPGGLANDPEEDDSNNGDGEFVAEFWILDVYKGAEKLAAQMGVMVGGGQGGVFGLRDQ